MCVCLCVHVRCVFFVEIVTKDLIFFGIYNVALLCFVSFRGMFIFEYFFFVFFCCLFHQRVLYFFRVRVCIDLNFQFLQISNFLLFTFFQYVFIIIIIIQNNNKSSLYASRNVFFYSSFNIPIRFFFKQFNRFKYSNILCQKYKTHNLGVVYFIIVVVSFQQWAVVMKCIRRVGMMQLGDTVKEPWRLPNDPKRSALKSKTCSQFQPSTACSFWYFFFRSKSIY